MLQFNEITKVFKSDLVTRSFKALDNVSFQIPEGSMVGFLGANGAGKTTSLKIIMDFIRPDTGSVKFSDQLGKSNIEVFKNIGFLPERPYFYPNLTGLEFLVFMGTLSEMNKSGVHNAIDKWAERFKIVHALNRPLKTYSKGMLQRIGFLATILHDPQLIILDEPLSGLDPIGRKELKDVIIEVHKEGKTVFFSSHIVPDIEEICDRVIFLKEGKLVYDGLVEKLIRSGQNSEYLIKYKNPQKVEIGSPIISSSNLAEDLMVLKVLESNKQLILRELLDKKLDVIGMELVKPSLEEIFYNVKAN
jgi:ABC-2 type transport system ATP-binding protein